MLRGQKPNNVDGAIFSACKDAGMRDDAERVIGALSKKI